MTCSCRDGDSLPGQASCVGAERQPHGDTEGHCCSNKCALEDRDFVITYRDNAIGRRRKGQRERESEVARVKERGRGNKGQRERQREQGSKREAEEARGNERDRGS